ncbi:MAG: HEAT repeat domain-containing protein [Clostridia bacterium]|nr:HEAT repeat domain-containing protein [Clostridia bacterium]
MQHIVNESNLYVLLACVFFCLCVCLYNVFNLRRRRFLRRRMPGRVKRMRELALEQLAAIERTGEADAHIARQMQKKTQNEENLFALEQIREDLLQEAPWQRVAQAMEPVLEYAEEYYARDKEPVRVYIARLIELYGVSTPSIESFVMRGVGGKSLYLRLQCLRCVAQFGKERLMVDALIVVSDSDQYDSDKCISDTLMDYRGDRGSLIAALFYAFDRFDMQTQRAVVGFLTHIRHTAYRQNMLELLEDEQTHKEVRIALLKYFTVARYDAAVSAILRLAKSEDWEYAAIASRALGGYPYRECVAQLKRRVKDTNWYVRFNCAMSLAELCSDSQLQDVLGGNDRFAREIMQYALTLRRKDQKKAV